MPDNMRVLDDIPVQSVRDWGEAHAGHRVGDYVGRDGDFIARTRYCHDDGKMLLVSITEVVSREA